MSVWTRPIFEILNDHPWDECVYTAGAQYCLVDAMIWSPVDADEVKHRLNTCLLCLQQHGVECPNRFGRLHAALYSRQHRRIFF